MIAGDPNTKNATIYKNKKIDYFNVVTTKYSYSPP